MQEAKRREARLLESAHAAAALQKRTHEARQLEYDQEHAHRQVRARQTCTGVWVCCGCAACCMTVVQPQSLSWLCA
jgi:hypothetical protein